MSPPSESSSAVAPVCPVCKSCKSHFLCQVDGYDIWRCTESATDFVWPMPSAAVLKKLYDREAWFQGGERGGYSDYDQQTEPSLHLVRELLDRFTSPADQLAILDVGCGYGNHLNLAQERGWSCFGIEPSAHAREICEQRHGDKLTVVERAEDLLPLQFNLVLMFEVIEHLQDPYALFFTLFGRGAIGPDTLVVISTPNARSFDAIGDPAGWAFRHPPSHLVFYSAESLKQLLHKLMFKDIQVRGIVPVQSQFNTRFEDEEHPLNDDSSVFMGVLAEARGSDFKEFMHERYVPGAFWKLTEYEHFPRYSLAATMAVGAKALDFGCGTGYGTAILSEIAASVTGLDISEDAILWAQSTHRDPKLEFVVRSDLGKGLPAGSFDLVTCFEMIEHVDHATQIETVQSIANLLKPDGKLVISTPDPQFTAAYGDNPYHLREMNEAEFMELLGESFKHVTILKQWVRPSIFIGTDSLANEGGVHVGSLSKSELADTPVGFVAICSHQPFVAPAPLCLFETSVDFNWETLETEHKLNRLRFKNHQWLSKFQRLEHQCQALDTAKNWFAEQNEALQGAVATSGQHVRELQESNAWSTSQRDAWEALAKERDQQIQGMQESSAWLLSQRDAWETLAKDRDQQIQGLQESSAWLLSQRDTWEALANDRSATLVKKGQQIAELQESGSWLLSQRDAWEALAGHRDQAYQDTQNQLRKLQRHPLVRAMNFLTGKKLFKP